MNKVIRGVLAPAIALGATAFALSFGSPSALRASQAPCEQGPETCCACSAIGGGAYVCISVEHPGVASCTFEYCSPNVCGVTE